MVSWLPHAVIPGLLALAFFRHVPRKTILMTLPVVWAIDVDYLIQSEHRAITHSVLWPAALLVAVVVLWRRGDPTARFWEFATRPGAPAVLSLLSFFWASHLLLDVFQGGVVLFWPLWDRSFFAGFQVLLDTGQNTFEPQGESGSFEGAPELSPVYPWVTYEHSAILVFLAATAAIALAVVAWRRRRGTLPARPAIVQRHATLAGPVQKP